MYGTRTKGYKSFGGFTRDIVNTEKKDGCYNL